MAWELFKEPSVGRGGGKILTINADAKRPLILIGSRLKKQGFDSTQKYELLFDREHLMLGLKPSTSTYAVKVFITPQSHHIYARAFAYQFKLTKRLEATSAAFEDGMWVVPLKETTPCMEQTKEME